MLPTLLLLALIGGHEATPLEKLPHPRFVSTPPATPSAFNAAAAKAFNVTARSFEFDFSPAPFVVNQGDSVSLTITAADTTHGFFVEHFMNEGVAILEKDTVTVNFIANTAGTFTYVCSIFCGAGHFTMGGQLTVVAPQSAAPVILSFTPASGPPQGGANVAITGMNFQNGATVRFGDDEALTTIVNSATSITAVTRARPAGSVSIKVTNPDGQTVTSASTYTFGTPPAAPGKRRRAIKPQ
jgi:plastocyanin